MSTLSVLRQSAHALLPGACFLRRDQQLRALFVTDFPRRQPDLANEALQKLQAGGFSVTEEKGLWLLDLSPRAQQDFMAALPSPVFSPALPPAWQSICRSLLSRGAVAPDKQPWEAVKRALLRLDAGEEDLLQNELRALCAVYKRQKTPLPTAIVTLINCHKEDYAC